MRLVVFVDPLLANSTSLLAATLDAAERREDVEVVGVVDTARAPARALGVQRMLAAYALRRALNLRTGAAPEPPPTRSADALARRRRVELLAPEPRAGGVNDPAFVAAIERLAPDATLALMVAQIFRAPLLAACRVPVNYHNGLLPDYQGVAATGWSIYERAPRSGFAFHVMSDAVDRGPVLLRDSVALAPDSATAPVERAKTSLARTKLDALFDRLGAGAAHGAEQQREPGSSFGRSALRAIRAVERPDELTLAELRLRLRAFEILDLTLPAGAVRATALRRVARRPHRPELAFATADGVAVEVSRVMHLPPRAYRALRPLVG